MGGVTAYPSQVRVPMLYAGVVSWWRPWGGCFTRRHHLPPVDDLGRAIARLRRRGKLDIRLEWKGVRTWEQQHDDLSLSYRVDHIPWWVVKLEPIREVAGKDWVWRLMGASVHIAEDQVLELAVKRMLWLTKPPHKDIAELVLERHAE